LFALSGGQGWNYRTAADTNAEIVDGDIFVKHIATVEKSDTNSINGRYNGGSATIITPYDTSAQTQGLALFSQYNLGASIPLNGRFYGGAWGQGQVDYDELTTLQDYLGTLLEPDIDPTDVTAYANVYEMLGAQTAAALFDINDKTSLRVETDGSGGVPVEGDPVGVMMDVSGTGGLTMEAYLEAQTNLTSATADTLEPGWSESGGVLTASSALNTQEAGWTGLPIVEGAYYEVTFDTTVTSGNFSVRIYQDGEYVQQAVSVTGSYTFVLESGASGAGSAFVNALVFAPGTTFTGTVSNVTLKALPGYTAVAASDAARPTLKTYNSPISSRDVLTTTYGWNITDGGRA
jgi:hypothetical protein